MYENKNWKRTDICIADGKEVIDVKLWGDFALKNVSVNIGGTLVCKNLHTQVFRGITSLSSTDETEIIMGRFCDEKCQQRRHACVQEFAYTSLSRNDKFIHYR